MATDIIAIVVGGGAEFGAPITIGNIPQVASITPPLLIDSLLRDVPAAGGNVRHIVVGATTPVTVGGAPTETFRTNEGFISESPASPGSVLIGEGAVVTGVAGTRGAIAIGFQASAFNGGSGRPSIVIGSGAGDNDQSDNVVIGSGAFGSGGAMVVIGTIALGQGGSGVVIGNSAKGANSAGQFVIGQAAESKAGQGMAVGNGSLAGTALSDTGAMAIGSGAQCQGGHSLALGFNAIVNQNGANVEATVIGSGATSNNGRTNNTIIGAGCGDGGQSNTIVIGNRITADFSRQLKIGFQAGGTATLPIYGVFIGAQDQYASYEGITYRHVNGLGLNNSVGPLQFTAPRGTGSGISAVGGLFAGIEFLVGAVDPAGSSVVQADRVGLKVLPQQIVPISTDAPIALPVYRDAAGAGVGTLTNAPHNGDPDAWVPVNLKGTVMAFPCWIV